MLSRDAAFTFASLALLAACGCGSAVKAPVGPPPEYEDARPPVPAGPASASAPTTPAASPPP
jgi:hypothetical protein